MNTVGNDPVFLGSFYHLGYNDRQISASSHASWRVCDWSEAARKSLLKAALIELVGELVRGKSSKRERNMHLQTHIYNKVPHLLLFLLESLPYPLRKESEFRFLYITLELSFLKVHSFFSGQGCSKCRNHQWNLHLAFTDSSHHGLRSHFWWASKFGHHHRNRALSFIFSTQRPALHCKPIDRVDDWWWTGESSCWTKFV